MGADAARGLPGTIGAVAVRRAALADAARLAPLFDAYRQFYQLAPDVAGALAWMTDRLRRGDATILVAADAADGTPLGFTQLYTTLCSLSLAPYAILSDLYVVPGARRRGVARQLLVAAREFAVETGLSRLELQTARDNVAARALYESLGWIRDDTFLVYTWRRP
jgi:GNAT superfamily N-acetyltransferase